jgi:hypothetical protein
MRAEVDSSETFHKLETTPPAPAPINERLKPTTPSPRFKRPDADSQAERTTSRASIGTDNTSSV